jgi:hypothetical protein
MLRPLMAAWTAALLAAACTRVPANDPAVVQDVLAYVSQIKRWEAVEAEVLKAIADVRRSQYVDDDYVIATLGTVMDDIEIHLEAIADYRPQTPRVMEVHDRYRHAWQNLHDAFAEVIRSMERKDYVALSRGTEAMKRSRSELITVAAALSLLLKEAGLKETDREGTSS